MKKQLLVVAVASILALTGCSKDKDATESKANKSTVVNENSTEIQKVSYILGAEQGGVLKKELEMMAESMHEQLDKDVFIKALSDAYNGKENAFTDEQAQEIIQKFQERKVKEMQEKHANNKIEGEKFLAENAKKEGVKTTASGLQYKVISEGTGKTPKATDTVVVHYEGKLIDGKVFDSSYERGMPVEFPLNGVIKGWTEGLQLMKQGAKYEFFIPAELAYGEQGSQNIEPNSVLIFTVELLTPEQAKKAQEQAQAAIEAQMKAMQEAHSAEQNPTSK